MGEAPLGTPNNLMPLVCQVASGQRDRLSIYGDDYETPDGTCIRDYIHVMDLAHGHVLTLKAMMGLSSNQIPKGLNVFNFGSGRGASVTELVECFERVNALKLNKQIAPRREGDVPTLIADTTRAREMLGWTAQRDLSEMCKDAWAWQQQNMKP
jgi:UDP-glucose 4-epimerase